MTETITQAPTLVQYAEEVGHSKYDWYFPMFDSLMQPRRDEPFRLLEIGCTERSLATWQACFPNARIVGLDHDNRGYTGEEDLLSARNDRLDVVIGDQTDVDLLNKLGTFDFVVDDGGHTMRQQQISFATLFPQMRPGGWYFIEDLHTSYMQEYQDAPKTTEFLKWLIDDLHANQVGMSQAMPVREMRIVNSLVAIERSAGESYARLITPQ